jgi:hypothetical protein
MRIWQLAGVGFSLLIVGITFWGRSLWAGLLAVLAGLGVVQARNAGGDDNPPVNPEMMVTCYSEAVMPRNAMWDSRWENSQVLNNWAEAERLILSYAAGGERDFDRMNGFIKAAQEAATYAKSAVAAGVLSQQAYELAQRALAEWHADMATSYSSVMCYRRAVPPPAIEDASNRLLSLSRLQMEGKISMVAVEEASDCMRSVLDDSYSSAVSAETAAFLMDLLGFRG